MNTIHRSDLNGAAICGAHGRISVHGVNVTCVACNTATRRLSREEAMRQIREAAARYQKSGSGK